MDGKPTDAAGVWAFRSQLKSHLGDSLSGASADSDFFLLLQALRSLFNAAGFAAEFTAQGDVADLDLTACPYGDQASQMHNKARWSEKRMQLVALLLSVLRLFLADSGDARIQHVLNGVFTWDRAKQALRSAWLATPLQVLQQVNLRSGQLQEAASLFSSAASAADALSLCARVESLFSASALLRAHLLQIRGVQNQVVQDHATHTAAFASAPADGGGDAARAAATAALAVLDLPGAQAALAVLPRPMS